LKNFKAVLINTSLALFSIFLALSFVELLFRLYLFGIDRAPFRIQNWVVEGLWDVGRSSVKLDYKLGWSPKTGTFKKNTPPHTVTIDKNNFRKNYPTESISTTDKAILFSGDSFTFGDGVDDQNTFPSIFQSIKNQIVINGGVQAYGIDQMYLRSLNIIQNYKISDLFFCFIPDDINRCNYSTFHKIQKPYFIFEGDSTRLIQIDPEKFSNNLSFNHSLFHKIGGYSLVIHKIMGLFFPKFWFYNIQNVKKKEHLKGKEISIQLINILKKECDKRDINLFIVPLTHQRCPIEDKDNLQFVLDSIEKEIVIINVFERLEELRHENPDLFLSYFLENNYHFSYLGNKFVANYIFKEIIKFP
tara:strand:+ start:1485 stop:2561 length:1077 start_codon:yes stop_codon:yes gene_type:complete